MRVPLYLGGGYRLSARPAPETILDAANTRPELFDQLLQLWAIAVGARQRELSPWPHARRPDGLWLRPNILVRGRSNPQLFPDLLQEPPVRSRRDDLVGRRLDHAELAQTQRPETDGVLGVVFTPGAMEDVV